MVRICFKKVIGYAIYLINNYGNEGEGMITKDELPNKFKKGLLKIPKIINWMMTILGLCFSYISISSGTLTLEWYIIVSIIIGNGIFLILCSLYEGFLYKKYTAQIQTIKKEEEDKSSKLMDEQRILRAQLENLESLKDTIIVTFLGIINKYNYYTLKLHSVNDVYIQKIKELAQISKKNGCDEASLEDIKKGYEIEYLKSVIEEYNEFMGDCTQNLKSAIDDYLEIRNINLRVSISIKQLNRIITDVKEIQDIKVITAFRDKETYMQGKREIGKREYTIYENTDFFHCLRNSFYINNDLLKDPSYNNQNKNYRDQYTCTTVVPIVWKYSNTTRLYGYLTCDVYEPEDKYSDVMDRNVAYMMNAVAGLLARYFDDVQYSVQNMVYKDFFSEVYKEKLGD